MTILYCISILQANVNIMEKFKALSPDTLGQLINFCHTIDDDPAERERIHQLLRQEIEASNEPLLKPFIGMTICYERVGSPCDMLDAFIVIMIDAMLSQTENEEQHFGSLTGNDPRHLFDDDAVGTWIPIAFFPFEMKITRANEEIILHFR